MITATCCSPRQFEDMTFLFIKKTHCSHWTHGLLRGTLCTLDIWWTDCGKVPPVPEQEMCDTAGTTDSPGSHASNVDWLSRGECDNCCSPQSSPVHVHRRMVPACRHGILHKSRPRWPWSAPGGWWSCHGRCGSRCIA